MRARIDWQYLLRLDLDDAGFDASVLVEFRTRLVEGEAERLIFDALLGWCRERQLVKARGRQRTDSTQVLGAVRVLNRVELAGETLRHALDSLAVAAPDWLAAHCLADWPERYIRRLDNDRLPAGQAARQALAEQIGADGLLLLRLVYAPEAPAWLREVPAVEALRRIWVQRYAITDGNLRWRVGGGRAAPVRDLHQLAARPGYTLRAQAGGDLDRV